MSTVATLPSGNQVQYVYDSNNPSRFSQMNLIAITRRPDAARPMVAPPDAGSIMRPGTGGLW